MNPRRVSTILVAAVALTTAGATAACSSGTTPAQTETEVPGEGGGPAGTQGSASEPAATQGSGGEPASGSGSGSGSGDGGSSGAILGTTRAQLRADALDNAAVPLRIAVVRLRATGELVDLELRLTNEATASGGKDAPAFQANTLFGDGSRYDASGIGLVDTRAQKLYLPVLDSDNKCLCTGDLGADEFEAGGSYTLAATYGGLPRDVTTVDVRVPQFPAVIGVRVQR